MKTKKWITAIICWFAFNACSQPIEGFLGTWRLIGFNGDFEFVDCPDFIEFQRNGIYRILNDCYGCLGRVTEYGFVERVTESGRWKITRKGLTLYQRSLTSNHWPFGTNEQRVLFHNFEMKNDTLILGWYRDYYEIYRKIR